MLTRPPLGFLKPEVLHVDVLGGAKPSPVRERQGGGGVDLQLEWCSGAEVFGVGLHAETLLSCVRGRVELSLAARGRNNCLLRCQGAEHVDASAHHTSVHGATGVSISGPVAIRVCVDAVGTALPYQESGGARMP